MKKMTALLLVTVFLAGCGCAPADGQKAPDYILEGFDGESSNCNWETNLFFTRMEEKTGISFQFREFTSYTSWQQRKNEILAGENLPDLLFKAELTTSETREMYEAGVLTDLKPYLEQYAPDLWTLLEENPDVMAAVSMPDGAIPALPAFNSLQNNDAMWINEKWLKRLGLETPETADELTEVLRAFRDRDPNGNGKKDEVPLAFIGMWELRFLGHAFGIIDNDYYITCTDGKVISSLTGENQRAFLTWLHELWEENLLDHNGFTTAESLRQITDEKQDIPYGMILSSTPLTVIPSASLNQYTMLMPLKYEGKQVYRDLTGSLIRGTFAITSRCKEPERLVQWVNGLYTEDGALMAQYGLEEEEYSWREDGLWEWKDDLTTVAEEILPGRTIASGAPIPGISPVDFQTKYADEYTRSNILQMTELKKLAVLPYPQVVLTREDEQAAAEIQKELAPYAEQTMARFVTGDLPLDDAHWQAFCETVNEKGLKAMIAIWQKYIDEFGGNP
ncbi:MAG: extracellular solute-binding protein [Clostridia bacterium]|nr:extracellular solute-binding protein [Clostridia bacterium]